jgi:D-Ala-D-Ala carboxypeptidase 3 (S13) family protein
MEDCVHRIPRAMTRRDTIRFMASAGGFLGIAAAQRPSLVDGINAVISRAPVLDSAFIGILVKQLDTGKTLYDRNGSRFFTPASVNTLFTTAVALARLGPDHRFITKVLAVEAGRALRMQRYQAIVIGAGAMSSAALYHLARRGQMILASPCSWHGFKFSIVICEILADLVIAGETRRDVAMFGLERFSLN